MTPEQARARAQARLRLQQQGGGGAPADAAPAAPAAPAQEDPWTWEHLSKNPTVSAVMHPVQSAQDMLRSTSNFLSFGGTDKLRSLVKGTPVEEERAKTQEASKRLGTWDEAANLGLALASPSAAG